MPPPIAQTLRYLVSGGVAWLVDFATFAALYGPFGLFWAQTAARTAGALTAFVGHKLFVFGDPHRQARLVVRQALQYAMLWLLSYGLSLVGIFTLTELAGFGPLVAKLMVESLLLVLNFITMKYLIFCDCPGSRGC